MSILRRFIDRLRTPKPKRVMTEWGEVSPQVQQQVEYNLIHDPETRKNVEDFLTNLLGSREAALEEAAARWPGAYRGQK